MCTTIADNAMESLITKACGARSMTQFAKACGISPMHMSRLKSGMCKPSKQMCIKLSNEPYVKQIGLTVEDFMRAAGYKDEVEIESIKSYDQMITNAMDTIVIGLITKTLMGSDITSHFVSSKNRPDVDLVFEILKGGEVRNLYVCIPIQKDTVKGVDDRFIYYYLMGRLFTLKQEKDAQYVMIMSDETMFERLKKFANIADIRANASVILMDLDQMLFTKEIHLGAEENYISFVN